MEGRIAVRPENNTKIKAILDKTRGRAHAHVYAEASEVAAAASHAEQWLARLGVPKKLRRGTVYTVESGYVLPRAYWWRYGSPGRTVRRTRITLRRTTAGWTLYSVVVKDYPASWEPEEHLTITPAAREAAIAYHLRGLRGRSTAEARGDRA